jgi:hypothetical protein
MGERRQNTLLPARNERRPAVWQEKTFGNGQEKKRDDKQSNFQRRRLRFLRSLIKESLKFFESQ